jgi:hypothetical protein
MRSSILATLVCASLLVPAFAQAAEDDDPPAATEQHWYGAAQTSADALAAGLTLVAIYRDDGNDVVQFGGLVGLSGLVFDGTVGHLVHGHGGKVAQSIALRLALPTLAGFVADGTCTQTASDDCSDSVRSGAMLGMFAALVIDDFVFAVEDRPIAAKAPDWHVGLARRGDNGFAVSFGSSF